MKKHFVKLMMESITPEDLNNMLVLEGMLCDVTVGQLAGEDSTCYEVGDEVVFEWTKERATTEGVLDEYNMLHDKLMDLGGEIEVLDNQGPITIVATPSSIKSIYIEFDEFANMDFDLSNLD